MACVPVVNVGITDVMLYPHTLFGTLSSVTIVSLPAGITEVRQVTVSSQTAISSVQEKTDAVNLSMLSYQDQSEQRCPALRHP